MRTELQYTITKILRTSRKRISEIKRRVEGATIGEAITLRAELRVEKKHLAKYEKLQASIDKRIAYLVDRGVNEQLKRWGF
jgi:ribosomal protein S10